VIGTEATSCRWLEPKSEHGLACAVGVMSSGQNMVMVANTNAIDRFIIPLLYASHRRAGGTGNPG
jgi:hypothetical protein